MSDVRTSAVKRFVGAVYPWDPAAHDGEVETEESMRERMDAAWSKLLTDAGRQEIGETEDRYEDGDLTPRRRLVRSSWTVDSEVPEHLLHMIDPAKLHGAVVYDVATPEAL